jgi:ubiquinone/menaquinone biosynthesis C-methylase UbiE
MGLENIMEFKEGEAEIIELRHSSFNAVFCRWGSRQDEIWMQ